MCVRLLSLPGGGRVVRWCWVNFQCRGVLFIWIRVGQGPTTFAVGAGGVVWTFFSRLSFVFSFSLFGRRLDVSIEDYNYGQLTKDLIIPHIR